MASRSSVLCGAYGVVIGYIVHGVEVSTVAP